MQEYWAWAFRDFVQDIRAWVSWEPALNFFGGGSEVSSSVTSRCQ